MTVQALLAFISAAMAGGIAVFGGWAAPRVFVHRVFAFGMGGLALAEVFAGLSLQAAVPADVMYWERQRLWVMSFLPGIWLLFSLGYARANYQAHVRRWRWGLGIAFIFPLAVMLRYSTSLLSGEPSGELPGAWSLSLSGPGYIFYAFSLINAVLILAHLERTLRMSAGSIRLQIKAMMLGVGSVFAVECYTSSQALFRGSQQAELLVISAAAILVGSLLMLISLGRYRLLNVEIVLSQTLLHHSATVMIVGLYLIGVGGVAKAAQYLGGNYMLPVGAVIVLFLLVGLIAGLLSDQLRYNIKRVLNRHIYRSPYDYRREWAVCTQRMASVVQVEELCEVACRIVSDTFGSPSVTVWLFDEDAQEPLALGGSTVFWRVRGLPIGWEDTASSVIRCLRSEVGSVDFSLLSMPDLSSDQRGGLREAKIRYGVALVARQQFLGVITLSDRLTQEPFSDEDFELLKTMADQAAASLLNLQLSRQLLRAKELEAFQAVSAFFVHDLKNLAAKLSLMVQNLPVHYDNPAFRDDMLQVISKSVSKMNAMCSRLTLITTHIELHMGQIDLNQLINTTLSELDDIGMTTVSRCLRPMPTIEADAEQLTKVLQNLLMNAAEALGEEGGIRVETQQTGRAVVISVSDDGCGMSTKFLTRSLFEPFQTTKSQGLGIGMFHSKMIVEAHRGRIEAESVEGYGSTFRVVLPIAAVGLDDTTLSLEPVQNDENSRPGAVVL